ncbi:LCP family protein [Streptomyces varsoviensis]|uniref:LCP family protein n=1 Tax=Streptomyces varsoviensis TaxID=67373 RepID=UPI0033E0E7D2
MADERGPRQSGPNEPHGPSGSYGPTKHGGRGRRSRARGAGGGTGGRPTRAVLALRAMVWAASAVVLVTCGVTWYAYRSLTDGMTTSNALDSIKKNAPKHLDSSVNLLLIGLDSRKDMDGNDLPKEFVQDQLHAGSSEIGYYNTNTLILMHIPKDGGKVQAFSVPRDDYVQTFNGDGSVQGHFKIKEAYSNAYTGAHDKFAAQGMKGAKLEGKSREAGRQATLATVQKFLDVPIDHFAEVNLLGFYDIAKVLQPITVCLKHPVKDHYSGADFPAGVQKLDAKQSLAFVRQRHGLLNGDLDRTRRQQAFISSVTHELKSQGAWSDLGKLQGLFDVVKKDLVLDQSWDVLDFAQQAPNLTGGNVVFHTLPITGFGTRNKESVNLVDPEQVRKIVQKAFATADAKDSSDGKKDQKDQKDEKAAPGTVDVRNGNGGNGAAEAELKALVKLGYTEGVAGDAPARARTTITYGSGADKAAQQIADRLKTAAPVASASVPAGHVVITLGKDYKLPAESPAKSGGDTSSGGGPSGDKSSSGSGKSSSDDDDDTSGPAVKAGGVPCVN